MFFYIEKTYKCPNRMLTPWTLPTVLLVTLSWTDFSRAAVEVTFFIHEEQQQHTLVGNIGLINSSQPLKGDMPSYTLLNGEEYFSLDKEKADLYSTSRRLDRESLCSHEVLDECTMQMDAIIESDDLTELVKIIIRILDVNDNAPRFPDKDMTISISEDTVAGTRFALDDVASDSDIQMNSILHYHLDDSEGLFSLEQEGTSLFLVVEKPLDRELQSVYTRTLVATDSGVPALSGSTALIIKITDVNDHCPTFPSRELSVTLPKNSTVNSIVLQLAAVDNDHGENGAIEYVYSNRVLETSKQLFQLNSKTGVITLASAVHEETPLLQKLTVLATGPGCPPALVYITVIFYEVITRPPKLELRFIADQIDGTVYLIEDYPLHTAFAILEVIDPDNTLAGPCYIGGESLFYLKPYDESLTRYGVGIAQHLDYELVKDYNVSIIAKDGSVPNLLYNISLQVYIEDVNDNDPQFPQSIFETSILENNEPGAFLITFSATDADSGRNGAISYHLGESAPSAFALDGSTGILTVRIDLDREQDARYTFLVLAGDQGSPPRSSTCTVVINVLDQNDNGPLFQNEEITFSIPENFPSLGEIGIINVSDADADLNGKILICIPNDSSIFTLNGTHVILRQNASVDYETEQIYMFWVQASDQGNPPQISRAKVTVHILDLNDNPPIILLPDSNFSYVLVLPNVSKGSAVAKVHAIDYDTGINGDISYSLLEQEVTTSYVFGVQATTGDIVIANEMHNIQCGLYQLHVKASDHGHPEPLHAVVQMNFILNYSISNQSYYESLIMTKNNLSNVGQPNTLSPCPQSPPASLFSLPLTVPAAIIVTTISGLFCIVGAFLFLHTRNINLKRKSQKEDVGIPLRINRDYSSKDWNEVH
ncbi:protocadherin-20-like [Ambystoma mexicanum]|uniref:protocadherin-20-like n=1 Tax=Ambystoma mexicanum TaxID=8296 RepID=UPI0037E9467B